MPNPSFSSLLPGQPSYTVTNSKDITIDLYLSDLASGAEFTLQCPTASTVTLVKDGTPPLNLSTTVSLAPTLYAGRTVSTTVNPADPISTIVVNIIAGAPAAEYWQLKINDALLNPCMITEGSNADIVRVLADPTITITNPVPMATFKDGDLISLVGTVALTQVLAPSPPLGLPAAPSLGALWTQSGGAAATFVSPTTLSAGSQTATVRAPVVYAPITLTYRLTGFYDLNSNSLQDTGEPFNNLEVTINANVRNHHMLLILDRSGSMLSSMGGVPLSKWEHARRAAHIWADLFIGFRENVTAAADKVGVMIFEANNCGWSSVVSSPIQVQEPSTGHIAALASIDKAILSLGSPGACTPIGDALIASIDEFVAQAPPNTIADTDRYIILLMTDGYENSGATVVEDDTPVPPAATGRFADRRDDGLRLNVNNRLTIFTVGLGPSGGVQENVLNDLPNVAPVGTPPAPPPAPNGLYRLVTTPGQLLPAFAEMLGYALDARQVTASVTSGVGSFTLNPNENRLAVVVRWENSTDQIKLSWTQSPNSGTVSGPGTGMVTGVTSRWREKHGIVTVNLGQLSTPFDNTQSSQWQVERWPSGAGAPAPIAPEDLLVMADLFVKEEITFDRTAYRTGDSIRITCKLRAGHQPISGATVTVELARPGESLGTFLATNSQQVQVPSSFAVISDAVGVAGATSTTTLGADPLHPKLDLLQQLLKQKGLTELPIVKPPAIFADGTNQLFDDGTHQDGLANDGDYANLYANTDKEGTYTWRFTIKGSLLDGSPFNRTMTISKWVGVNVDPVSSVASVTYGLTAPAGYQAAQIFITPVDQRGEYLGPFHASELELASTTGSFQSEADLGLITDGIVYPQPDGRAMVSHYDGRYSRVLIYKRDETPILTISAQGKPFLPIVVAPGCLGYLILQVRSLLGWLLKLVRH